MRSLLRSRRTLLCAMTFFTLGLIAQPSYSKEVITSIKIKSKKPFLLTVVYPDEYDKEKSYPVILALPPGRGNAQMVRTYVNGYWKNKVTKKGYIVVCPEILGPTIQKGTGKKSLEAVLDWIDKNIKTEKNKIILAGASNGGLGAFYTAVAYPHRFSLIISMPGGYLGNANNLRALKGKPVWLLVGEKDTRWVQLAKATRQRLKNAGAKPELEILKNQTHVLRISPQKIMDWIEKHRKEEAKLN